MITTSRKLFKRRHAAALAFTISMFALFTPEAKAQASGTTLGDILDPFLDFFECRTGSADEQLLCRAVRTRVNDELAQSNLSIDANGILFGYDDPTHIKVDTGHSCTVTARIERRRASARLGRGATFDFRGNAISEPVLIGIKLPVTLDVRFDLKQSFGARDLFGCHGLGSDHYSASGSLNTDARIAVMFTLAPSLSVNAGGDLILTIRPMVRVATKLERTDVNLRVSGVSPVSGVATALLAGPSTLLKGALLFDFDKMGELFKNSALTDLALPILLDPGPLGDAVFSVASKFAERQVDQRALAFGDDLQATLMNGLRRALKLDGEDKRVFVIRKDFASILRAQGERADIYLATPPSDCTFKGRTIAHGSAVTAYASAITPLCEPCESERRTCNNGVLSGVYTVESCVPRRPRPGQACP
ncbi:hypothetical protein [Archangium lipolyticum]|uniref:hypothetical protein n=1 Tax=Archangium lipolyticum TaxID=2970465 RepID=UPI00214CFF0D|nr:hypothetical protein [Archangium lipolyticum]